MVYTSALCTTELAVHTPLGIIPSDYWLLTISFPDSVEMLNVDTKSLPSDWKSFPYDHSTQALGVQFISDAKYLIIKVPSVVVQDEFNYLINPAHKSFGKVKVVAPLFHQPVINTCSEYGLHLRKIFRDRFDRFATG